MKGHDEAPLCECGEHRVSDKTCKGCGKRAAVYGGWWCCVCRAEMRKKA